MGDIHYIVDKLNAPPFKYNLTLLSFSEKTPPELLQLLSDVFSIISPKHQRIDVSKEDADQTVDRLLAFLKIIKYKPNYDPVSFRQLLAAGDRDVVYPILKWVVPQPSLLEKRAFVGYYLSYPDMPEDLAYDPEVMELKDDIKTLQGDFVDTHKAAEAVRALNKDAQALKARIKSLEEEKERLTDKIERAKGAVDKVADKQSYLDVCTALRKHLDEEVALSQQLQTQKALLEKAEASHGRVASRLRELQSSYQEGSAAKLLDLLTEEVKSLRFQVNERYPKELEKRQRRATALQEAFTNGVNTEVDLQRLQAQANKLHAEIAEIADRRAVADKARAGDKSFVQLRQAQQMAGVVAKKKEELQSKLDRLQEKKATTTAQVEKLTAAEGGAVQLVSEEEWRSKYEAMKSALPQYKAMKKELGDLEAEVFVLAYTEEQLAAQETSQSAALKKVERQAGVQGFSEVVTGIEKVSEAKSAIDEVKGQTLQEISRTVEDINAAINERKVRLAPQIKKLRQMRQSYIDLEGEHKDRKGRYDAAMSQYDSRVSSLQTEVTALKQETMMAEQKYHLYQCQLAILDQDIRRITSGPPAERLRERYQLRVTEAEEQSKALKEKLKELKEMQNTGLSQIDMMQDLIRLLQVKADCQRKELGFNPIARQLDSAGVMGMMGGGGGGDGAPGAMRSGPGGAAADTTHTFDTATANVMVL